MEKQPVCYSRVEQTGEYVFLAVRHRYQVDGRLGAQQIEIGFSTCQTERRRCERVAGIMLLTVIEQCPESLGITVGMLFGRNGDYGHTEIFQREKPVESVECKYIVLIEIAEENHSLQLAGFVEIADATRVSINTALGRMRYAILNMRRIAKENNITLAV